MSAQTDPQGRAALIDFAEMVELARRDLLRTSTDFLGRMAQCLSVYEGICEQPDDEWSDATRAEAEEELTGLIGLALAQLALVRAPDSPLEALQSPSIAEQARQAEEAGLPCERCQGNGELVTDWDRYLKGRPGDVGDEAVEDCPDCFGTGRIAEQDGDEAARYGFSCVRETMGRLSYVAIVDHQDNDARIAFVPFSNRFPPLKQPDVELIVNALNSFCPTPAPSTDAMREAQILRDHISEQITHAETRIKDGTEMGATVWRIALEDIARENRKALSARPLGDGLREDRDGGRVLSAPGSGDPPAYKGQV